MDEQAVIKLSNYPGFYRSSMIISFDVETSALSDNTLKSLTIQRINKILNKYCIKQKSLGTGENNRSGIKIITGLFNKYAIHGTWFVTGHCLLKGNKKKDAYRINQIASYSPHPVDWRILKRTFSDEPYSTYKKRPDYYLGDVIEKLAKEGEDIQCHSFSHPYLSLESDENITTDIEDWQKSAKDNGIKQANIFAFPYLGDSHMYYPELNKVAPFPNFIKDENFVVQRISGDSLNILKKNNIELLARCTSKEQEKPGNGFLPYDNENTLFYIPFETLYNSDFDENRYREIIDNIISNQWIVDFWCHPQNVTEGNSRNFETFLKILIEKQEKQEVLITTMDAAWTHFKKVNQIKVENSHIDADVLEVSFKNPTLQYMNQIGCNFNNEEYSIEANDSILTNNNFPGRFVIKQLEPDSILRIKMRKVYK